jgi:ADP-ribosylglycohydrolase
MEMISDLAARIRSGLLGLATGDALGVPVEFLGRAALDAEPVTGMRAFGSHRQPAGTWSDDTSLTLCLADSLASCGPDQLDFTDQAQRFVAWRDEGRWTARGAVFDIGIATSEAIHRMAEGIDPVFCGGTGEMSNGNGSLMRILPLAFWLRGKPASERRTACFQASALTHGHSRSKLACWLYVETARGLCQGLSPAEALLQARATVSTWTIDHDPDGEWRHFARCLPTIASLPRADIKSSGYVVHTMEAALWCLLGSASYAETVLKAVNLGNDTDTTAAVAGGLAGLLWGEAAIPEEWLAVLARREEITALAERLGVSLGGAAAD